MITVDFYPYQFWLAASDVARLVAVFSVHLTEYEVRIGGDMNPNLYDLPVQNARKHLIPSTCRLLLAFAFLLISACASFKPHTDIKEENKNTTLKVHPVWKKNEEIKPLKSEERDQWIKEYNKERKSNYIFHSAVGDGNMLLVPNTNIERMKRAANEMLVKLQNERVDLKYALDRKQRYENNYTALPKSEYEHYLNRMDQEIVNISDKKLRSTMDRLKNNKGSRYGTTLKRLADTRSKIHAEYEHASNAAKKEFDTLYDAEVDKIINGPVAQMDQDIQTIVSWGYTIKSQDEFYKKHQELSSKHGVFIRSYYSAMPKEPRILALEETFQLVYTQLLQAGRAVLVEQAANTKYSDDLDKLKDRVFFLDGVENDTVDHLDGFFADLRKLLVKRENIIRDRLNFYVKDAKKAQERHKEQQNLARKKSEEINASLMKKAGVDFPTLSELWYITWKNIDLRKNQYKSTGSELTNLASSAGFKNNGQTWGDFNTYTDKVGNKIKTLNDTDKGFSATTLKVKSYRTSAIKYYAEQVRTGYKSFPFGYELSDVSSKEIQKKIKSSKSYKFMYGDLVFEFENKGSELTLSILNIVARYNQNITKNTIRVTPIPYGKKTYIKMKKGQTVWVKAWGSIELGAFAGYSSPNGIRGFTKYSVTPNGLHGGLIARVDSDSSWSYLGSDGRYTAPKDGQLMLGVNDIDDDNNSGEYFVSYVID